ncbi:MAG TPA: iron ABC transporter permease [Roseomonas sp.]|nr:iron ABC transporter permease [Roseomonas sp.]
MSATGIGRGVAPARVEAPPAPRRFLGLQRALPAAGVIAGLLLVAGPLLAMLVRSLLVWDGEAARLSLANFTRVLSEPRVWEAVGNTALCGAGATLLSCALGFTLAWLVARTDMPGRRWLELGNLIPFFLSPYVGAISWIYLFAPGSGLLQQFAMRHLGLDLGFINIYSLGGVIWVLTLFYTPYVYLFVMSPLKQMDAALEDAARVHGAGFWYTLRHVSIPLVSPALLSGALVVFITSAGLFDVPLALALPSNIPTMPTEIFAAVQYPADFGRAAAFGMMVLGVTILLTMAQRRYLARRRYEVVTGKGYRPRLLPLGRGGRIAALTLEAVYIGGAVLLPMMALVMVSLSRLWTGSFDISRASLANFTYVLFSFRLTQQAILNSLTLAVTGATIGVALAVLQAYYLNRGTPSRRGLADALLSLPLGIPGIILGLGFLILAIRTPLYSTLTIVLIAYVARFFPFATRTISAMFLAINPELEQSARASGASWAQSMRWVLLPLLKPAVIAAWLMLFVIFIRELGATILLYAQGTETISVALVLLADRSAGYVAALAVVQLVLLLLAFTLFRLTRTTVTQS